MEHEIIIQLQKLNTNLERIGVQLVYSVEEQDKLQTLLIKIARMLDTRLDNLQSVVVGVSH